MTENHIIEKIRKLLALAADPGCAGAEAENAARMATRLMLKHEIDENMVNDSVHRVKVGFAYARHMNKGKLDAPKYCGMIAIGVADFLGCVVSQVKVKETDSEQYCDRFKFAGAVEDVKFAVWLCETMCAQALREFIRAKTEEHKLTWLNGFATAVQLRLRDMTRVKAEEEAELKASDSMALMVIDGKVALVKEKFGETSRQKANCRTGCDGYNAGMRTVIPTGALTSAQQTSGLLS